MSQSDLEFLCIFCIIFSYAAGYTAAMVSSTKNYYKGYSDGMNWYKEMVAEKFPEIFGCLKK